MNLEYIKKTLQLQNLAIIYFVVMYLLSPLLWSLSGLDLASFRVNQKYVNLTTITITVIAIFFFWAGTLFKINKIDEKKIHWESSVVILVTLIIILCGIGIKLYRIYTGEYKLYYYADFENHLFIFKYLISLNIFFIFAFNLSAIGYYSIKSKNIRYSNNFLKYLMWTQFFIYQFCYLISYGNKFYMITLVLNLFLIKSIYTNKVLIKNLIFTILFILIIFPLKIAIQNIDHLDNYMGISVITDASNKHRGVIDVLLPDHKNSYQLKFSDESDTNYLLRSIEFSFDAVLGRINQAHIIGYLINRSIYKISNSESLEEVNLMKEFADENTGVGGTVIGDLIEKYSFFSIIFILFIGFIYKNFETCFHNSSNDNYVFIYISLYTSLIANLGQDFNPFLIANIRLFFISIAIISLIFVLNKYRSK